MCKDVGVEKKDKMENAYSCLPARLLWPTSSQIWFQNLVKCVRNSRGHCSELLSAIHPLCLGNEVVYPPVLGFFYAARHN